MKVGDWRCLCRDSNERLNYFESLSGQHGFVASVCGDVDGGLGTYESDERSGR